MRCGHFILCCTHIYQSFTLGNVDRLSFTTICVLFWSTSPQMRCRATQLVPEACGPLHKQRGHTSKSCYYLLGGNICACSDGCTLLVCGLCRQSGCALLSIADADWIQTAVLWMCCQLATFIYIHVAFACGIAKGQDVLLVHNIMMRCFTAPLCSIAVHTIICT